MEKVIPFLLRVPGRSPGSAHGSVALAQRSAVFAAGQGR